MTETPHTRSRNASLGGLILQILVFGGLFALGMTARSAATGALAWYALGGVPIWFVALLVFRQRELAALEALDLEELRREKKGAGAGEALFGEDGAGGLGFRVADARLQWMQRWLVPGFGLATAVYLLVMGFVSWRWLAVTRLVGGVERPGLRIGGPGWPELANVPIALVVLAIIMLGTFLLSRYTSGMARVKEWQLLRGCGSYMLGNALVVMVLMVCLGVRLYAGVATWEQTLAFVIPVLMAVLAIETIINLIADIYRPRAPGIESRACFDSRLLGLFAEPGGIASSIAEAINYQFGFQVSQTWFYQLLQRTFVPLVATGAAALWLLTCIVVVQPYEHVIVERFGRQLNADDPYGPGAHLKLPWPIDVARAYNTGQLHQISVGFQDFAAVPELGEVDKAVLLWTDTQHMGHTHFDFLICPSRRPADEHETPLDEADSRDGDQDRREAPVHLFRMDVVVQYRICPDRLSDYTTAMAETTSRVGGRSDAGSALRNIAWEELGRFTASTTADDLLGSELSGVGEVLRRRMSARVAALGLEVVYVGVINVHPEKTVAEAFRNIVKAEQEKVGSIREALVIESERLSRVAGDVRTARALATAVARHRQATQLVNSGARALSGADQAAVATMTAQLGEFDELFRALIDAEARLDEARQHKSEVDQDFELGLGRTAAGRAESAELVVRAQAAVHAALATLEQALAAPRAAAEQRLGADLAETLVRGYQARVTRIYWQGRLDNGFAPGRLEGEAAATLAAALAERWAIEMERARQLTQVAGEREAYRAAPEVYRARRLFEVLVQGMKDSRKFFLAFEPGDRLVRVRYLTDDQVRLEPMDVSPER